MVLLYKHIKKHYDFKEYKEKGGYDGKINEIIESNFNIFYKNKIK